MGAHGPRDRNHMNSMLTASLRYKLPKRSNYTVKELKEEERCINPLKGKIVAPAIHLDGSENSRTSKTWLEGYDPECDKWSDEFLRTYAGLCVKKEDGTRVDIRNGWTEHLQTGRTPTFIDTLNERRKAFWKGISLNVGLNKILVANATLPLGEMVDAHSKMVQMTSNMKDEFIRHHLNGRLNKYTASMINHHNNPSASMKKLSEDTIIDQNVDTFKKYAECVIRGTWKNDELLKSGVLIYEARPERNVDIKSLEGSVTMFIWVESSDQHDDIATGVDGVECWDKNTSAPSAHLVPLLTVDNVPYLLILDDMISTDINVSRYNYTVCVSKTISDVEERSKCKNLMKTSHTKWGKFQKTQLLSIRDIVTNVDSSRKWAKTLHREKLQYSGINNNNKNYKAETRATCKDYLLSTIPQMLFLTTALGSTSTDVGITSVSQSTGIKSVMMARENVTDMPSYEVHGTARVRIGGHSADSKITVGIWDEYNMMELSREGGYADWVFHRGYRRKSDGDYVDTTSTYRYVNDDTYIFG